MYKIVSTLSEYLGPAVREVESKVKELKKEGWVEQGGVSISHSIVACSNYYTVAQAMVKKEE